MAVILPNEYAKDMDDIFKDLGRTAVLRKRVDLNDDNGIKNGEDITDFSIQVVITPTQVFKGKIHSEGGEYLTGKVFIFVKRDAEVELEDWIYLNKDALDEEIFEVGEQIFDGQMGETKVFKQFLGQRRK